MKESSVNFIDEELAKQYASDLRDKSVLNDAGYEFFLLELNDYLYGEQRRTRFQPEWLDREHRSDDRKLRTRCWVLNFLNYVFERDYHFRKGTVELVKAFREDDSLTADSTAVSGIVENSEGLKIERSIEGEEVPAPDSAALKLNADKQLRLGVIAFNPLNQTGPYNLVGNQFSALGRTRRKLLDVLLEIELIAREEFEYGEKALESFEILLEAKLPHYISDKAVYYQNLPEKKKQENKILDGLHREGALSEANYDILKSRAAGEEILGYDIFPVLENSSELKHIQFSAEPLLAYRQLFEELAGMIPDFKYSDLELETEILRLPTWVSNPPESESTNIVFSFMSNDKRYQYGFDHSEHPKGNFKMQGGPYMSRAINLALKDAESPLKLYQTRRNVYNGKFHKLSKNEACFTVMTESQKSKFGFRQFADAKIDGEFYFCEFNAWEIHNFIRGCKEIGLFTHLNDEQIRQGFLTAYANGVDCYSAILRGFEKVAFYYYPGEENDEKPYTNLLSKIAEHSGNLFNPIDISEASDGTATSKFSFSHEGQKFETELKGEDGHIDFKFFTFLDDVLDKSSLGVNFYMAGFEEHWGLSFLFLNEKQKEKLSEKIDLTTI